MTTILSELLRILGGSASPEYDSISSASGSFPLGKQASDHLKE